MYRQKVKSRRKSSTKSRKRHVVQHKICKTTCSLVYSISAKLVVISGHMYNCD